VNVLVALTYVFSPSSHTSLVYSSSPTEMAVLQSESEYVPTVKVVEVAVIEEYESEVVG
jgi:hypothetical protein